MKNILLSLTVLVVLAASSCKTSKDVAPVLNGKTTFTIKVPAGFTWQNSRNLNFTVNLTDTRFASSVFLISIFDRNPALGGHLLAKGSATTKAPFTSKVFTSDQVTEVYIIKTAPDNSQATQTIQVGTAAVITSIGM
jgi:hypothetical protein